MKSIKKIPITAYISLLFFLTSGFTYIFKFSTFDVITILVPTLSYLLGICIGMKGAIELRRYNNLDGTIPLSRPITLIAISAMLLTLPSFISTGTEIIHYGGNENPLHTIRQY